MLISPATSALPRQPGHVSSAYSRRALKIQWLIVSVVFSKSHRSIFYWFQRAKSRRLTPSTKPPLPTARATQKSNVFVNGWKMKPPKHNLPPLSPRLRLWGFRSNPRTAHTLAGRHPDLLPWRPDVDERISMFTDTKFCFLRRLFHTAKSYDHDTRVAIQTIDNLLNIEQIVKNRISGSGGKLTEDEIRQCLIRDAKETAESLRRAVKNNHPTFFASSWALYCPTMHEPERMKKDGYEKKKKWTKELQSDPTPFFGGDDLVRRFYAEFPNTDVFEPYFGRNLDT